jgi:hypothetical protein
MWAGQRYKLWSNWPQEYWFIYTYDSFPVVSWSSICCDWQGDAWLKPTLQLECRVKSEWLIAEVTTDILTANRQWRVGPWALQSCYTAHRAELTEVSAEGNLTGAPGGDWHGRMTFWNLDHVDWFAWSVRWYSIYGSFSAKEGFEGALRYGTPTKGINYCLSDCLSDCLAWVSRESSLVNIIIWTALW